MREKKMYRRLVSVLLFIVFLPVHGASQDRCAIGYDYLIRARERCHPNASTQELKEAISLLGQASYYCQDLGDVYYYRHLCEKKLGNQRAAENLRQKAKEYRSEALDRNDDPFALSTVTAGAVTAKSAKVREKWALVIGVSNFKNHSPDKPMNLQFAAKDAQDFYAFLTDSKYGRFKNPNVRLLTDSQATKDRIAEELRQLAQKAERDDLVVLYFSSHGTDPKIDARGASYLATYETALNSDLLSVTALPMVEIVDTVQSRIRAQRVAVFIDTCHGGAIISGQNDSAGAKVLVFENRGVSTTTLERFQQGIGRIILAASQANELSWEGKTFRNGIFTYYLLEGLRQKHLEPVENVYYYLKDRVSQRAQADWTRSQTPVMKKSNHTDDILIGIGTQMN